MSGFIDVALNGHSICSLARFNETLWVFALSCSSAIHAVTHPSPLCKLIIQVLQSL